ncbi:hypothetical protein [uncultured Nitrospira sp.]|uniref:hypothetical protein n=1 Tax=uncultured Nitrospira sp. TaxID=157176 RepID=UPI00314012CF
MMITFQRFIILSFIFTTGFIVGCSESSSEKSNPEPKSQHAGFTANVDGAVHAEILGDGIVTYLPPKERTVTGNRPGYYMLVNNLPRDVIEEREFFIIFRIPDGAQPGHYNLMTPDPLKVGQNFDVQVEAVEKGQSIEYQNNTEGTITLDNFSPDRSSPEASTIKGTFQFVTENNAGERVSINGTFDFPTEKNVVSLDVGYSFREVLMA